MFQQNEDLINSYNGDETEMLQTDIQRFLAILAFCLLPIFMLVQSISVVGQEKEAVIENLALHVEEQNRDLERFRIIKTESTKKATHPMKNAEITEDLKAKIDNIDQPKKQINPPIQKKIPTQHDFAAVKSQPFVQDEEIRKVTIDKNQFNDPVEEKTKNLKTFVLKDVNPDVKKNQRVGLYVAFESDGALLDLIEAGKIKLIIHVSGTNQSFRMIRKNGDIHFETSGLIDALDLWEIKEIMVPDQVIESFRKWTPLASKKKMFVVGVSPEISQKIRETVTGGGRLIIGREGQMLYSPFGE